MTALRPCFVALVCLSVLAACTTQPPENGPDNEYNGPAIVDLSPTPGQSDFFFEHNLWAQFESAPDSAYLTLLDSEGTMLSGQIAASDDGTHYTLDPAGALTPSSDYTLEIRAGSMDANPLLVPFRTSAHGLPVDPAAGGLAGAVYRLDLSNAFLVEPASAGAVIISEIDSWNLLLGFAEESSFESDQQPGVHIYAAFGRANGASWEQDPCSRTASLTFGQDGLHNTADDTAATWNDPYLQLGPGDIDFLVGLVVASVQDLRFSGVFRPDLGDMKDFSVEGIFDTRALDIIFERGPDDDEGITCDLLEALEINCQECGNSNPGAYCVPISGESIAANRIDLPSLRTRTCADVIEHGLSSGECTEELQQWEPTGDGSYALCPEYLAPSR